MRKGRVLADLDQTKECENLLTQLENVAFQSDKSQVIYNEIKSIRERLTDKNFHRGRKSIANVKTQ